MTCAGYLGQAGPGESPEDGVGSLDDGSFFDAEVLVENRRSKGFGIEIEGEGAVLVKAGEQQVTAGRHLLSGRGAEHLVDGVGTGKGDRFDFRLGHGDEEQDVPAEQLDSAVDHFGAHGRFGQIGDPENERAARLEAVEGGGGAEVIGFSGFGTDLGQSFNEEA